jgi:3'-phosphoadenosine 5'-phosphosulfate sulfotransferase (PAPS reductase)/FAD synthetase
VSLREARDTCRTLATETSSVLVALSGKDSLAVLSVASEFFERIACFHMYYVRGLRCVEDHLERMAKRHNAELIYLPQPNLARDLKQSKWMPQQSTKAATMRLAQYRDVEAYAKELTKTEWVLTGQRADDSFDRRILLKQNGVIDRKTNRAHPIAYWHEADVFAYLRAKKIPFPIRFGNGRMSDFGIDGETLRYLRDRFPDDYQRVLEVFPHAEAEIVRQDVRRARKERDAASQTPGVRDAGHSSSADQVGEVQPTLDRQARP